MKKLLLILALSCFIGESFAADIKRMEPANWWVGMKNPELQVMVYGENIANTVFSVDPYPGVVLKEVVKVENPNYLFVYLDVTPSAKPGTLNLNFAEGRRNTVKHLELKARDDRSGAKGFDSSDVLYLIMPDSFANGDPSLDNVGNPNPVTTPGGAPRRGGRLGGDIKGIVDHLDYLKDLGVTTIWTNPVLENSFGTNHGYAIVDYYNIDPRLGTNEDYRTFVAEAHKRGLKVVMDMIFNHCGSGHWWMADLPSSDWLNDYDKYGNTTHYKWTLMDPHAPQSEKDRLVKGWFSRGMPDLNQRNRHVARYIIQNCVWWIEYSRMDGIRQDTHPYADYDFMAGWCREIAAEYPEFNIVGEGWYPRITGAGWWQAGSDNNKLGDSELPTVMDFETTFMLQTALDDESNTREGYEAGLFKLYEIIAQDFLIPNPNNVLVFLDNHDIKRFMRKEDTDLRRFKQGVAYLLTTRGIPQVYYGTEVLLTETRPRFPGGWAGDPDAFTPEGRTPMQNEAWNYLSKLLNWRKGSLPVTTGRLTHYTPDNTGTYVYARYTDDQTVLVVMNGTDKDQEIDMNRFREVLGENTRGKDVITERTFGVSPSDKLQIAARDVYVLELSK
jgi:glycosidase